MLALIEEESAFSSYTKRIHHISAPTSKVQRMMSIIDSERRFGSHPHKVGVVITLRRYEKTRYRTKGIPDGAGSMSRPQLIKDHVNAIRSFKDFGIMDIRSFIDVDLDLLR